MNTAVKFHQEQLGLSPRFESPQWSEFDTGAATLALHFASTEHPAGTCQVGFMVPDVDAFYAEKSRRGIELSAPPVRLHGQNIVRFKDSDGFECSLGEP